MLMGAMLVVVVASGLMSAFCHLRQFHLLERERDSLRPDCVCVADRGGERLVFESLWHQGCRTSISHSGRETVEYLKLEFYEPSEPFQKYISVDGGPAKVFIRPHGLTPLDAPALTQDFPHHEGCSQWERACQNKWPAALSWGGLSASWPCAEFFRADSHGM